MVFQLPSVEGRNAEWSNTESQQAGKADSRFAVGKRGNCGWHNSLKTLFLLKIQRAPRNGRNTRGRNRGAETLAW